MIKRPGLAHFFKKSSPNLNKSSPISWHNSLYLNCDNFQKQPKKLLKILCYFCWQICCKELSKIDQSGHTIWAYEKEVWKREREKKKELESEKVLSVKQSVIIQIIFLR